MAEKLELSDACKKLPGKLYNRRYIGGKHTEEKNVLRALKQLPKNERKKALDDWDWCKKQSLVITWLKTYEVHVSLNPQKLKKIAELRKLAANGENDETK
ncbi:hypothetical protein HYU17_05670 [Candidatus Woesearchaeota archaeon]|nr:hypothetical protein [Candidatus Woesearchaeota archaeon]